MIVLFFLQHKLSGGTTTFSAHLAEGFRQLGHEFLLVRVRDKKPRTEEFGEYGHLIHTVRPAEGLALARANPSVILTPGLPEYLPRGYSNRLLKAGSIPVLHDITKRWFYPKDHDKFICIRQSVACQVGGTYIGHPYARQFPFNVADLSKRGAISTARVHNSKRTSIILKANEVLKKTQQVKVLGTEFRLYSYGLAKRYKSFKQSGHVLNWPLTFKAPVKLCESARYNVDFTRFIGDGGGTQYCQLEAMDAGCVNIMHRDWCYREDGSRIVGDIQDGKTVLTVANESELAELLTRKDDAVMRRRIIENGYRLLMKHDAKKIAKQYVEYLT